MSAESDKMRDTFADQLASYDDKLHATANNAEMLADIQAGIAALLASSRNSEGEIRQVLQDRYDQGGLRKETFQLVKSMLDRYTTENVATFPVPEELASRVRVAQQPVIEKVAPKKGKEAKDVFGTTDVIPVDQTAKSSADARVQVGSLLRDRFLLQEKIAGGSMGVVYKALDRRLAEVGTPEQWVAIKILSPQLAQNGMALRALQQEAAKGRCLVHPNIVRFIDLDRDDDLYFLVMEWLEGRTLANILDSEDRALIDRDAAFRITRQVGDALNYAHRCGIVHADVKPGNIMIMPNGDAKLFDFGVARVRQKQEEEPSFDPGILGAITPAYSSMQVLTGEEPVAADDVFSLACLLYRLVAGYRVFGPRNAAEASQEGMTPQRVQSLNESAWRALKKALSYARVTRFDSIREFLEALDNSDNGIQSAEFADDFDAEKSGGSGFKVVVLALLLGVLGATAYQFGYLDSLLERIRQIETDSSIVSVTDAPPTPAPVADNTDNTDDAAIEEVNPIVIENAPLEAADDDAESDEERIVQPEADGMGPTSTLVDFSSLPAATIVVPISVRSKTAKTVRIALREDGAPAIVDFVRDGDFSTAITLRLEEVGFSGNRSPWASGQFNFSDSGVIHFPAGQSHGRVTLTMTSDPRREADQQSTLKLREIDFAKSSLAILTIALEDDDQRAFESRLPVNTIAFAASQASIRESDPAVQIDVVRFNPDDSTAVVGFSVRDITATEGEDYFAPGNHSITFGPRQRSARLLVPLVQDVDVEGDEAFVVELSSESDLSAIDVYRRIVVMIRDDEPQPR